jgi:hypothetical protein
MMGSRISDVWADAMAQWTFRWRRPREQSVVLFVVAVALVVAGVVLSQWKGPSQVLVGLAVIVGESPPCWRGGRRLLNNETRKIVSSKTPFLPHAATGAFPYPPPDLGHFLRRFQEYSFSGRPGAPYRGDRNAEPLSARYSR